MRLKPLKYRRNIFTENLHRLIVYKYFSCHISVYFWVKFEVLTVSLPRYSDIMVHRLLAVAIGALDSYPDLLNKNKTQVRFPNLRLTPLLPSPQKQSRLVGQCRSKISRRFSICWLRPTHSNKRLLWIFKSHQGFYILTTTMLFALFPYELQKLCNHLNMRHKMAQYASRDSIDLHCQVSNVWVFCSCYKVAPMRSP